MQKIESLQLKHASQNTFSAFHLKGFTSSLTEANGNEP